MMDAPEAQKVPFGARIACWFGPVIMTFLLRYVKTIARKGFSSGEF
jgi:hypothetical protein